MQLLGSAHPGPPHVVLCDAVENDHVFKSRVCFKLLTDFTPFLCSILIF
jgi:hypothetical protein